MRARLPLLLAAILLVGAGAALGTWRVAILEELELEQESEPRSLREAASGSGSARLAEVRLRRGEEAVFELCGDDPLAPERWADMLEIAVWNPESQELLARMPLSEETLAGARRSGSRACVTIARGLVPADGTYAVEAVWSDRLPDRVADVPLRLRTLARVPLGPIDRVPVVLSIAGAVLLVLLLALGGRAAGTLRDGATSASDVVVRLAMGVALVLAAAATVAAVPIEGAAASLAGGLLFAAVEVGAAVAFVPRRGWSVGEALALVTPHQSWLRIVGLTAAVALVLVGTARLAVALIPSTGEAPIQTFVSWPSGLLSFALLAVLVPLAEEIFFRGFVYGAALELGRVAAFALAAGLFVAAHTPQVWGGWGGLVAVTCTGIGLTALRAWSGSVLPGAAAHLAYNALLAASAVF